MRGLVPGVPTPHSLLGVLPGIYSDDDLTRRLVGAFDDGLVPVFVALDNVGAYLDPALTPPDFLRWLGGGSPRSTTRSCLSSGAGSWWRAPSSCTPGGGRRRDSPRWSSW